MLANIGTKVLPDAQFEYLWNQMNGYSLIQINRPSYTIPSYIVWSGSALSIWKNKWLCFAFVEEQVMFLYWSFDRPVWYPLKSGALLCVVIIPLYYGL